MTTSPRCVRTAWSEQGEPRTGGWDAEFSDSDSELRPDDNAVHAQRLHPDSEAFASSSSYGSFPARKTGNRSSSTKPDAVRSTPRRSSSENEWERAERESKEDSEMLSSCHSSLSSSLFSSHSVSEEVECHERVHPSAYPTPEMADPMKRVDQHQQPSQVLAIVPPEDNQNVPRGVKIFYHVLGGASRHSLQLTQAKVVRAKGFLMQRFELFMSNKLVLLAEKRVKTTRAANIHLYDMTRAMTTSHRMNKKSGNFLGKLRSSFSGRKLLLQSPTHQELALVVFSKHPLPNAPREFVMVLPWLGASADLSTSKEPARNQQEEAQAQSFRHEPPRGTLRSRPVKHSRLLAEYRQLQQVSTTGSTHHATGSIRVFETKPATFDDGTYRLDFDGRVTKSSIKNFQFIPKRRAGKTTSSTTMHQDLTPGISEHAKGQEPPAPVQLQFGKVDAQTFHLDFEQPLFSPLVAFAAALAQFN